MPVRRVALLTAGGLAPCLSSAVGGLIQRYTEVAPDVEIIGYLNGYAGLLGGTYLTVTPDVREKAPLLHLFCGSPIGNSRAKLTNVKDRQARSRHRGPEPAARRRGATHPRRRQCPAHHRRR
jgi:pyrophosphate--fructose-6-phosphate 1-phosphotransferase